MSKTKARKTAERFESYDVRGPVQARYKLIAGRPFTFTLHVLAGSRETVSATMVAYSYEECWKATRAAHDMGAFTVWTEDQDGIILGGIDSGGNWEPPISNLESIRAYARAAAVAS